MENIIMKGLDILKIYEEVNKKVGNISLMEFVSDYNIKFNMAQEFFQPYVPFEVLNRTSHAVVELYCLSIKYSLSSDFEKTNAIFLDFMNEEYEKLMQIVASFGVNLDNSNSRH